MRHRTVEVNGVTGGEFVIIFPYFQIELAFDDKEDFDPSVLVRLQLVRRNQEKIGIERVQFALASFEVETFKPVGTEIGARVFGESFALVLSNHLNQMSVSIVVKEELKSNTEYHGNTQQGGESWNELATFDLREQSSGETGVLAKLDQSHALLQSQGTNFLADEIRPKPLCNGLVYHADLFV